MEEIVESVYYEIKSSGFEKKLIAGIVITGGGAQLKHITQLVEYITGMDTRIGYPNEHLGKGMDEVKSPMYATGVGLVIKGLQEVENERRNPSAISSTEPAKDVRKKGWWTSIFNTEILGDDKDEKL
jgi:cell division protein FtsA